MHCHEITIQRSVIENQDSSSLKNGGRKNHKGDGSMLSSLMLPTFIEIKSDEDDSELHKKGSKMKQYKKEKSLGILCQQLIHLFVTWKHVLSLEEAAKKISFFEMPDK